MTKKTIRIKKLVPLCVLALMMAVSLIPQTGYAAGEPNDVQTAETLAALQDDGETSDSPILTVRWSSIDGEDFVEPFTFEVPAEGISIFDFLVDNRLALIEHFAKDGYSPADYFLKYVGLNPMSNYDDSTSNAFYSPANMPGQSGNLTITENTVLYFYMFKSPDVTYTVDPLPCAKVIGKQEVAPGFNMPDSPIGVSVSGEDADLIQTYENGKIYGLLKNTTASNDFFFGTIKGGETYYLEVSNFNVPFGYGVAESSIKINGAKFVLSNGPTHFVAEVKAVHDLDEGKITKEATTAAEGVKSYTCKRCGETITEAIPKLPEQMGSDGTALGPGASSTAAERAILTLNNDSDPKGTAFSALKFKASKTTASSIKLTWKKAAGAATYVVYANKCGKNNKYQKLTTLSGSSLTVKNAAGKKLKKGTYYKFILVALDSNDRVVSTSKTVHAATAGKKVGNHKKVTTKAKKKKVTLKAGKTFKLKAKAVKGKKKVSKHRGVCYESTNTGVATVSKKGVIKGVKKGTCYVNAYAQNGVCATVKVTVK